MAVIVRIQDLKIHDFFFYNSSALVRVGDIIDSSSKKNLKNYNEFCTLTITATFVILFDKSIIFLPSIIECLASIMMPPF